MVSCFPLSSDVDLVVDVEEEAGEEELLREVGDEGSEQGFIDGDRLALRGLVDVTAEEDDDDDDEGDFDVRETEDEADATEAEDVGESARERSDAERDGRVRLLSTVPSDRDVTGVRLVTDSNGSMEEGTKEGEEEEEEEEEEENVELDGDNADDDDDDAAGCEAVENVRDKRGGDVSTLSVTTNTSLEEYDRLDRPRR